jgi:hypothetical protein
VTRLSHDYLDGGFPMSGHQAGGLDELTNAGLPALADPDPHGLRRSLSPLPVTPDMNNYATRPRRDGRVCGCSTPRSPPRPRLAAGRAAPHHFLLAASRIPAPPAGGRVSGSCGGRAAPTRTATPAAIRPDPPCRRRGSRPDTSQPADTHQRSHHHQQSDGDATHDVPHRYPSLAKHPTPARRGTTP